jgi:hypothetical protein
MAALQPFNSESPLGLACCVPSGDQVNYTTYDREYNYITCSIKLSLKESKTTFQQDQGQCWHASFRGPVIVAGFPIPWRSEGGTGLEISRDDGSTYGCPHGGDIQLQGPRQRVSAMFVPTKRFHNAIVWHLLHNPC